MGVEVARARFVELGGDAAAVAWGAVTGEVPRAGSHQWLAMEVDGGDVVLGGLDRGRFVAYGRFGDPRRAAETLTLLLARDEPAPLPRSQEELARAARGVVGLLEEAEAAAGDGSVAGSQVPVGAVLDHIGNGSGHVLHPLGTAMSQRSLPPTDLTQPRTGYLLLRALPDSCRASRIAPWFGQPGGGWMIELDRVIDYYCDTGVLRAFAVPEVGRASGLDRPDLPALGADRVQDRIGSAVDEEAAADHQ